MINFADRDTDGQILAMNVRRLMARRQMTYEELCSGSGLDERTIRGIMNNRARPHARTLAKLAAGLAVEVDELFAQVVIPPDVKFDRATNRLVEVVRRKNPNRFKGWNGDDFRQLYSNVGVGGMLTEAGILAIVDKMNEDREVRRKVRVIHESAERDFLAIVVEHLYRRVTVSG